MPRFSDPAPLAAGHALAGFACGEPSLDVWLTNHARQAAQANSAQTYVITDAQEDHRAVGYYALTVGAIEHDAATDRVRKGMPRHPIPVVILALLAVDQSVHGHGLGPLLLQDAMRRVVSAAAELGIRGLLVHALNDRARAFYLHLGLEPSPTDPRNLQIVVKDIVAALGATRA